MVVCGKERLADSCGTRSVEEGCGHQVPTLTFSTLGAIDKPGARLFFVAQELNETAPQLVTFDATLGKYSYATLNPPSPPDFKPFPPHRALHCAPP